MKILNLYSGLGGNRKLWGSKHKIVAVEINPEIATIYKELYPDDEIVIGDAHEYLLQHFAEFDFIWSSPPCQSHSSFRFNIGVRYRGVKPVYPDMRLYEEIIFLQQHAKCLWIVENVKPYYEPLIKGKLIQRHLFWSNFELTKIKIPQEKIRAAQIRDLQKLHNIDLSKYKIKDKRQLLRNCVDKELAVSILNDAEKLFK